jgi:hypothetical protein
MGGVLHHKIRPILVSMTTMLPNPLPAANSRRPFSFGRLGGDSLLLGFVGASLSGGCG